MNIMLACAAGMSTSLLVTKMKMACKEQGKDYKIWATDIDSIEDEEDPYDVVLIGPQVSWRLEEVREYVNKDIPIAVIDRLDYGKCDGVAVLKATEKLVKEHK